MPSKPALFLAAESGIDPRTCERALRDGVDAIRTRYAQDAIRAAAAKLKIALPKGSAR